MGSLFILTPAHAHAHTPGVQLPLESGASLRLRFHLPTGYPDTPPECEASSSELSRRQHSALSALARSTAESPEFEGRECIFDILGIVHEAAHKIISDSAAHVHATSGEGNSSPEDEEEEELCCLKLDHMRDEQRYIKHIRTWTRDLGLRGRCLIERERGSGAERARVVRLFLQICFIGILVKSLSMPCLRLRGYVGVYYYHPAGAQQNQFILQRLNLRLHHFWGGKSTLRRLFERFALTCVCMYAQRA